MYIINGNKFRSELGFYKVIEELFKIRSTWGRNLDAFADILEGGYGILEFDNNIEVKWINYKRSARNLKPDILLNITEILNEAKNIKLKIHDYQM